MTPEETIQKVNETLENVTIALENAQDVVNEAIKELTMLRSDHYRVDLDCEISSPVGTR